MKYLLSRLSEPSTYAGIAGLLFAGSSDFDVWVNLATALAAAVAVVLPDRK